MSLLCLGPSQGQLIKAYIQVQEVLPGGWFGFKFIAGNLYKAVLTALQNITEYAINLGMREFLSNSNYNI